MDFESPSEDEDLETKMYAMIHFVDSENTQHPNIDGNFIWQENNIKSYDFVNGDSLSSDEENLHISPILTRNNERRIIKDIPIDNLESINKALDLRSEHTESNQNNSTVEPSVNCGAPIKVVPSIVTTDTEFNVKSLKSNDNIEKQYNSINDTCLKNHDSCDIIDLSDDIGSIPEQNINTSSQSEVMTDGIFKTQPKTKTGDTLTINQANENLPSESEHTIVIKNQRANECVNNKKNISKKTNSLPLKPISLPSKSSPKVHKNHALKPNKISNQIIDLDTSGDESDVEVIPQAVIPLNSIYIESSDDEASDNAVNKPIASVVAEEMCSTSISELPAKSNVSSSKLDKSNKIKDKNTCVSPVPSVISSISDEFILADCSNLNITSNEIDSSNLKFNFDLHGADLCGTIIEDRPKKRKRPKKKSMSIDETVNQEYTEPTENQDSVQKTTSAKTCFDTPIICESGKDNFVTPKCNSLKLKKNNSVIKSISYTVNNIDYVTPSLDVYESESSDIPESVVDVPITFPLKRKKKSVSHDTDQTNTLVMANVIGADNSTNLDSQHSGFKESPNIKDSKKKNSRKRNRNKIKSDQSDDLESFIIFDSGADFDHVKLQKDMPNGKEFWPIDLADKLREKRHRKNQVICGYCNKAGHRDSNCYSKPKKCSMCGAEGHKELRCPNKICLNCGSQNYMFASECRNCFKWKKIFCATCKIYGHPSDRCPDIWRRYHRTITNEIPLIEEKSRKHSSQLFCSGCTGRGHLINSCKEFISFSEFTIPPPHVFDYTPVYDESVKRQNTNSGNSGIDGSGQSSNQVPSKRKGEKECIASHGKKSSDSNENAPTTKELVANNEQTEKTVSDNVVASSQILLTQESILRINSNKGKEFIKLSCSKFNIGINQSRTDLGDVLILTGSSNDHEGFRVEFKKWLNITEAFIPSSPKCNLPKNKIAAVNYLMDNLNSLNKNFGNPQIIHRNLQSLEKEYKKLVGNQNKIINPKKLQSLCNRINNSRQLLNKILIGQAGFSNGHANIDKLKSIIVQLNHSQGTFIKTKTRKQIVACYLPIFSEASRDDYSKLINQYTSSDTPELKSKNYKGRNQTWQGHSDFKRKPLLDRIRLTRRKLQKSSRNLTGDPYAIVDSTCRLLDLCENQIIHDQTSKDTFYNLKKITSRVDKYIFDTQ